MNTVQCISVLSWSGLHWKEVFCKSICFRYE